MRIFRRGQSIMDVLVAVAVMVIGIAASSAMMIAIERSVAASMNEARAVALAEEGAQAAISIGDRAWDELAIGMHGLMIQTSPAMWIFQGVSDAAYGFTRTVEVSVVDEHTKKAAIVVSWDSGGERTAYVEDQILLTNWAAL